MSSVRQENRYRKLVRQQSDLATAHLIDPAPIRPQRKPAIPPKPGASRRQVRAWMRNNASEYETATNLAEAANIALDLPYGAMDDPDHWIWDEAINAIEKTEGATP